MITEIERFAVPIAPETPAGESLRFDAVYDDVKRLREHDDATLPQGVWQRELKRADWPAVAQLCSEALEKRSKDLQLAAWLTESWVHLHGFFGLAGGLRVISRLCKEFWPVLYPAIDEDGSLDARLAPVIWTVDKMVLPLKSVPITSPKSEDALPYGWKAWESGQYLTQLAKNDPKAAESAQERGMVPSAKFLVSVSLTPSAWYGELVTELVDCMAAVDELDAVLTAHCGEANAPSFAPLRTPLAAMQAFVGRIVGERVDAGDLPVATLPVGAVAPEENAAPFLQAPSHEPLSGRAEAYQKLREASEYLMRTEPHSPVPYLVRRAISWGNMSLAELLDELLQKNADVNTINTLLGIRK
ncbi:MAG TPA: type VI secretion system protein TssA [Thermoanaerobaculia bacterium]